MRIWMLASLALATGLGSPARTQPPRAGLPAAPPPPAITRNDHDCGVIAAVAIQHFHFGPSNPALPVKVEPGVAGACTWSAYGLAFTPWTEGGPAFVSFAAPTYDANGASIAVSRVAGPLAGQGWTCRVRLTAQGWKLETCTSAWIS